MIEEIENLGSPVGAFDKELCTLDPASEVPCDDLFEAWKNWCDQQGRRTGAKATFGRDLRTVVPAVNVVQHDTAEKRGQRFYRCLGLKSD